MKLFSYAADEDWRHGGFGVYLHWPFCQSKCPYCDFNSHVAQNIDQDHWADLLEREITRVGRETEGRVLNSVYFGGGTPSLMTGRTVGRLMDRLRATWSLANDCEVTLEANPGSVEIGRFRDYRMAGVNRVSIGVQAMNDQDLRRLGRMHSHTEALQAIEIAGETFDRFSFDLIYARQDQSLSDWEKELNYALSLGPNHLSLYQLTIEDGTVFGERFAKGQLRGLPDEDLAVDMFELTQELTTAAGLPAYEVSNHARIGHESRHNRIYWTGGDYAGIGPGAHGRLTINGTRYATEAEKAPGKWLATAQQETAESRTALSPTERGIEYVLMGLRLNEGIDIERYKALSHQDFDQTKLTQALELGLIRIEEDRMIATESGRMLLNRLIALLLGA